MGNTEKYEERVNFLDYLAVQLLSTPASRRMTLEFLVWALHELYYKYNEENRLVAFAKELGWPQVATRNGIDFLCLPGVNWNHDTIVEAGAKEFDKLKKAGKVPEWLLAKEWVDGRPTKV